jgi:hypothetical protein
MANPMLMRMRRFLPYLGLGLIGMSALVAVLLYLQRGAHLELKGSIQKVRTLALPDSSTVVVIDFRFANPSDYLFVVRQVEVLLDTPGGQTLAGAVASDADARQLFTYYPILGQRYNETLLIRSRVAPRQSHDRMLAARFELSEEQVQQRKGLRIRVEDVDGAVCEIQE